MASVPFDFHYLLPVDHTGPECGLGTETGYDPLGLIAYQYYKRHRGVIGESVIPSRCEFLTALKQAVNEGKVTYKIESVDGGKLITILADGRCIHTEAFLPDDQEQPITISEALTPQQRLRRKLIMKRLAPKLARARKMAMTRRGGNDVIKRRATALARSTMARKLLGGRNKADVSTAERARVERIMAKRKKGIERLATKLMPVVRRKQSDRFAKKQAVAVHKQPDSATHKDTSTPAHK